MIAQERRSDLGLYKPADGNFWWFSVTYKGKRFRETLKTEDKGLAKRLFAELLPSIYDGTYGKGNAENTTMASVIDRYMQEASPLQEPTTHERNRQIAEGFKAFFNDVHLSDVTPSLLSTYKAKRLSGEIRRGRGTGRIATASTVKKELSFLRQVFGTAIEEWELCTTNPVRKVIKGLKDEKRVRFVTPDEAEKLRFTIPVWLKPIVIVACQTGLRKGNLLNLTLSQVDFNGNRINIGRTKNGEPLSIAMTSIVSETLKGVIRTRKLISPYVFVNEQGRTYSPFMVSKAFQRACGRAKVVNLRIHDLRHDFATLMLRKTRNLVDVQHALGHSDPRMSLRYAHMMPEDLDDAFKSIDGQGTAGIWSGFGQG